MPTKIRLVKAMVFPVVMYGCEIWTIKNTECPRMMLWTVVLKKTRESPLECKGLQRVYPKENQTRIFIGRIDADSESPILWPPDKKNGLIWRLWCWEQLKAGGGGDVRGWDGWMAPPTWWPWVWQAPRVGNEQGSLACCSPWGRKESDTTERLNGTAWKCTLIQLESFSS